MILHLEGVAGEDEGHADARDAMREARDVAGGLRGADEGGEGGEGFAAIGVEEAERFARGAEDGVQQGEARAVDPCGAGEGEGDGGRQAVGRVERCGEGAGEEPVGFREVVAIALGGGGFGGGADEVGAPVRVADGVGEAAQQFHPGEGDGAEAAILHRGGKGFVPEADIGHGSGPVVR